jgi:hypothetical protein
VCHASRVLPQRALAQRRLPTYGTEYELLLRLEDALAEEAAAARQRINEERNLRREIAAEVSEETAARKRAEVSAPCNRL